MAKKPSMRAEKTKSCEECGESIQGRTDKKFCSDQCRVTFNNRIRATGGNPYIRSVTDVLKRNHKILSLLNTTGKTRVSREKLSSKGFNFTYFTSQYTTREGAVYRYVFDQGYLEIDKATCLLVVRKEIEY